MTLTLVDQNDTSGKPNRMKLRFDNPLTVPQVSLGVSGTSSGSSSSGSSTSVEPPTPGNLDKKTTITFGGEVLEISPENIEVVSQLGRGAYGIVERVKHTPSGHEMAVKVGIMSCVIHHVTYIILCVNKNRG